MEDSPCARVLEETIEPHEFDINRPAEPMFSRVFLPTNLSLRLLIQSMMNPCTDILEIHTEVLGINELIVIVV